MRRLQGVSKADVLREFGGAQFSTFKTALVDLSVAKLGPIGTEMKRLVQDPVYIDSVSGRRLGARAGDRRRNHEGGQGHRRFRPRGSIAPGLSSCRRAPCHHSADEQQTPQLRSAGTSANTSSSSTTRQECDRAVYWAAKRAGRTKSQSSMLRVIETGDRNQQWLGVADIMQAEAMEAAKTVLDKYCRARRRRSHHIKADRVIREGDTPDADPQADRRGRRHRHPGAGGRHRQRRPGAAGHASRQDRRQPSRSRSPIVPGHLSDEDIEASRDVR